MEYKVSAGKANAGFGGASIPSDSAGYFLHTW